MKAVIPFIIICTLLFSMTPVAECDTTFSSIIDKISIKSVDAFQFESKLEPPIINIVLTIQNKSDRDVRIKNGHFEIIVNPFGSGYEISKTRDPLSGMENDLIGSDGQYLKQAFKLGDAFVAIGDSPSSSSVADHLKAFELPANSDVSRIFKICLPTKLEDRIRAIYLFINYMGFPRACRNISMRGSATVGIRSSIGWTDKSGVDLDLLFSADNSKTESQSIGKPW